MFIMPPSVDVVFSDALTDALRTVTKAPRLEELYWAAEVDGTVVKVDCYGHGFLPGSKVADLVFVDGKGYIWTDLGSKANVARYDHALMASWVAEDAATRIGALIRETLAS